MASKIWLARGILLAGLVPCGNAAGTEAAPAAAPSTTSSATTQHEVTAATAAMDSLQVALIARLRAEMQRGGPKAAVSVCRDSAQAITARIARRQGLLLGRTSHRLRNPADAPRAWARATVVGAAGSKSAAESLRVFDLGDSIGVLRPIGTASMCSSCHGPAETVRAAIGSVLEEAYPKDEAVGFATGELRGFMWAQVPKAPPSAPRKVPAPAPSH